MERGKAYQYMGMIIIGVVLLISGCTKALLSEENIEEKEVIVSNLATNKDKQYLAKVIADLEWEFVFTEEKETVNGIYTEPTTSLYLKSKTNPKCILDLKHQVVGSYMEDEQGRDDYPKDAYMPLSNWYGGGGENIMIKLEDTKCFYVKIGRASCRERVYVLV